MNAFWSNLTLVTPVSLALACVATFALLGSCFVVIARTALAQEPGTLPSDTKASSPIRSTVWLALLFLLVFSAKLLLMRDVPATTPFSDQWDGEAVLFGQFHDDRLDWAAMIDFHNEHRILFSRLLALGLLTANGQWDPRLEQVVNAAIHASTALLLATVFWIASARRHLDLIVLVAAVTFALPFGWENTLIGFQSTFYFLLLYSVLALWLTTVHRPGTGAWWLGWICAVCSLFTIAGGVITPAVMIGIAALKLAADGRWRDAIVDSGAAAVVLALGIMLSSPPLAYHARLKAQTLAAFRLSFAQNLAWPWIDQPWLGVAMWLPLAAALAVAARSRLKTTPLERFVAGLGLWVALNAAALAYARGVGGALPASRYLDLLSIGFAVNFVALIVHLERTRTGTLARRVAVGILAGWLCFAFFGIDRLMGRTLMEIGIWRSYFAAHVSSVRKFVMTDDVGRLRSSRPWIDLPHRDPNLLVTWLQDPYIGSILPAAVRAPLRVRPRIRTGDAFVLDGPFAGSLPDDTLKRAWSSLSEQGPKAQGRFESQPLRCKLGQRLLIQVSGNLGREGQRLALRDLDGGVETVITPARVAREGWSDTIVPCPSGPFEIVAADEASDAWFAFREPVEIGWASVIAESLIRRSREPLMALLGIAALLFAVRWAALVRSLVRRRRRLTGTSVRE